MYQSFYWGLPASFFLKVSIVKFRDVQDVGDILPEVLHCTRRRWRFKSLSYDENGNEESNLRT